MMRILFLFTLLLGAVAKFVSNSGVIPAWSGVVDSKFVYDRSLIWTKKPANLRQDDELYILLFDDQWESFPQASAVWEEASCEEKLATARWNVRALPEWTNRPEGFAMDVNVTQKTRPRTWYAAIVSCADHPISYSMDSRLINPLRGVLSEFSYDELWHLPLSFIFVIFYGLVYFFFAHSLSNAPAEFVKNAPEGARNLWRLLGVALMFSCVGAGLQMVHFFQYMFDGVGFGLFMAIASLFLYASKGVAMNLLLLLARGELFAKEARSLFDTASSMPQRHDEGYGGLGSFNGHTANRSLYVDEADLEVASAFEAPNKVLYSVARMSGYAKYFMAITVWVLACWVLEMWGEHSYRARFTPDLVHETTIGMIIVLTDVIIGIIFCVKTFETVGKDRNEVRKLYYKKWTLLLSLVFAPLPLALLAAMLFGHWIKACIFFATFHYVTVLSLLLLSLAINPVELSQPLAAAQEEYTNPITEKKTDRNRVKQSLKDGSHIEEDIEYTFGIGDGADDNFDEENENIEGVYNQYHDSDLINNKRMDTVSFGSASTAAAATAANIFVNSVSGSLGMAKQLAGEMNEMLPQNIQNVVGKTTSTFASTAESLISNVNLKTTKQMANSRMVHDDEIEDVELTSTVEKLMTNIPQHLRHTLMEHQQSEQSIEMPKDVFVAQSSAFIEAEIDSNVLKDSLSNQRIQNEFILSASTTDLIIGNNQNPNDYNNTISAPKTVSSLTSNLIIQQNSLEDLLAEMNGNVSSMSPNSINKQKIDNHSQKAFNGGFQSTISASSKAIAEMSFFDDDE